MVVGLGAGGAMLRVRRAEESTLSLDASSAFERGDGRLARCGNSLAGQAAEIDDVGAFTDEVLRLGEDAGDVELRRVDDLGEDGDVVPAEVHRALHLPRNNRQVGGLVRAAGERHAEESAPAGRGRRGSGRASARGRCLRGSSAGARRCSAVISAATFTPTLTTTGSSVSSATSPAICASRRPGQRAGDERDPGARARPSSLPEAASSAIDGVLTTDGFRSGSQPRPAGGDGVAQLGNRSRPRCSRRIP